LPRCYRYQHVEDPVPNQPQREPEQSAPTRPDLTGHPKRAVFLAHLVHPHSHHNGNPGFRLARLRHFLQSVQPHLARAREQPIRTRFHPSNAQFRQCRTLSRLPPLPIRHSSFGFRHSPFPPPLLPRPYRRPFRKASCDALCEAYRGVFPEVSCEVLFGDLCAAFRDVPRPILIGVQRRVERRAQLDASREVKRGVLCNAFAGILRDILRPMLREPFRDTLRSLGAAHSRAFRRGCCRIVPLFLVESTRSARSVPPDRADTQLPRRCVEGGFRLRSRAGDLMKPKLRLELRLDVRQRTAQHEMLAVDHLPIHGPWSLILIPDPMVPSPSSFPEPKLEPRKHERHETHCQTGAVGANGCGMRQVRFTPSSCFRGHPCRIQGSCRRLTPAPAIPRIRP